MMNTLGIIVGTLVSLSPGALTQERQIRTTVRVPIQRPAVRTNHKFKLIQFISLNLPDADLRPTIKKDMLQVKDQGGRGTCSIFAVTFCHEYLWATDGKLGMGSDLSEEYLNYVKNVACELSNDGGFFSEIDKGYQKYGCYMAGLVPYKSAFDPKYKVPQPYIDVATKWKRLKADFIKPWDKAKGASGSQIDKACEYIKANKPVAAGFLWPNNLSFTTVEGLPMMTVPTMKSQTFDGHSIALVGYKRSNKFAGGGYFIIRNSWGDGWGEEGYAYMPFDYVAKYCNDLLAYHF